MGKRQLDPSRTTLLALCIAKGGLMRGSRVALFIMQWAILHHVEGREPTVVEYFEYWREKERKVRRYMAEFRELFDAKNEALTPEIFVSYLPEAKRVADAIKAGEAPSPKEMLGLVAELQLPRDAAVAA